MIGVIKSFLNPRQQRHPKRRPRPKIRRKWRLADCGSWRCRRTQRVPWARMQAHILQSPPCFILHRIFTRALTFENAWQLPSNLALLALLSSQLPSLKWDEDPTWTVWAQDRRPCRRRACRVLTRHPQFRRNSTMTALHQSPTPGQTSSRDRLTPEAPRQETSQVSKTGRSPRKRQRP